MAAYPGLFRLLWHSGLPCSPSTSPSSPHLLRCSGEHHLGCRRCSWQGKVVNCSDIFTPVITDMGVCCSFNIKTDILKDSPYKDLVEEMQVQVTETGAYSREREERAAMSCCWRTRVRGTAWW